MTGRAKIALALLLAFGLGAAVALLADKLFWDNELKLQLAQREQVIADLQSDLSVLRSGLDTLKTTNDTLRHLIDASLKDAAEVARSNKSSVEKLRGVIVRLEALKASLAASP